MGRWYEEPRNSKAAADGICDTIISLAQHQMPRINQALGNVRLYQDNEDFSSYPQANLLRAKHQGRELAVGYNVVREVIDALWSIIVSTRILPMAVTDEGSPKDRMGARKLNRFYRGLLYSENDADKTGHIVLSSLLTSLGATFVKTHINGDLAQIKLQTMTMPVMEIFVDPEDARYGNPRNMYVLLVVDRNSLLKDPMLEGKRKLIEEAGDFTVRNDMFELSRNTEHHKSETIPMALAYRRAISDTDVGRYSVALSTGMLHDDDEWERTRFPYAFFRCTRPIAGFFPTSVADAAYKKQLEINRCVEANQRALKLLGNPIEYHKDPRALEPLMPHERDINQRRSNRIGEQRRFMGERPMVVIHNAVNQEALQQIEFHKRNLFMEWGLDDQTALGLSPTIESGIARNLRIDQQNRRQFWFMQELQNYYIQLAHAIVDEAKYATEKLGKRLEITFLEDGVGDRINWKDISYDANKLSFRPHPVSALSQNPAERLDQILTLRREGLLSDTAALESVSLPDVAHQLKEATAMHRLADRAVDIMTTTDKKVSALPEMDPVIFGTKVTNALILGEIEDLSEVRKQNLRDFISDLAHLQKKAQEANAPSQSGQPIQAPGLSDIAGAQQDTLEQIAQANELQPPFQSPEDIPEPLREALPPEGELPAA